MRVISRTQWREILQTAKKAKKSKKAKNPYAICTDSVGGTAGTTERSEWDAATKRRYDRCIKHVKEDK